MLKIDIHRNEVFIFGGDLGVGVEGWGSGEGVVPKHSKTHYFVFVV